MSLPAWGAWIEILMLLTMMKWKSLVAPRMGSVD